MSNLFLVKPVIRFLFASLVFIAPAYGFVAIDELVDPSNGKRIIIFGDVHTKELAKEIKSRSIDSYFDPLFSYIGAQETVTSKSPLILAELKEQESLVGAAQIDSAFF